MSLCAFSATATLVGVFFSWSATLMHQAPGPTQAVASRTSDAPATLRSVVVSCLDRSLGVSFFRVHTTRMGAAGWGSFAPGYKGSTWHARSRRGQLYQVGNFYSGPAQWAWNGFALRVDKDQFQREVHVAVPTWFALLVTAPIAWRAWVTRRRALRPPSPPHECTRCGYDLRGVAAERCPECGHPHASAVAAPRPS